MTIPLDDATWSALDFAVCNALLWRRVGPVGESSYTLRAEYGQQAVAPAIATFSEQQIAAYDHRIARLAEHHFVALNKVYISNFFPFSLALWNEPYTVYPDEKIIPTDSWSSGFSYRAICKFASISYAVEDNVMLITADAHHLHALGTDLVYSTGIATVVFRASLEHLDTHYPGWSERMDIAAALLLNAGDSAEYCLCNTPLAQLDTMDNVRF